MAVAAPARRSRAPAAAPPPSRTSPPRRRKAAQSAAAPAPARRKAPARAPSRPARRAPARRPARRASPASRVAAGGQLAGLAVGRTAVAVRHLPDSGLVVRMTRGRAWIAVLGALLAGIVALNVITLSFAASASRVDERNTALEQENTMLESRLAHELSGKKTRHEAALLGLAPALAEAPTVVEVGPGAVAEAARRLAAAG